MDIFEERYYNLNRKLLVLVGLWPYEDRRNKYLMRVFFMAGLFLLTMPHLISVFVNNENVDRFMLNTLTCLICLVMFLKMVALTASETKMKKVFRSVADNWLSIRDEKEREILLEYSERGRRVTIFYIATFFTAGSLISLLPLVPKIIDIIYPLGSPREDIYVLQGEYLVNSENHFVVAFFSDYAITMFATLITIAIDTMYITSAEHCCALNAIIMLVMIYFANFLFIRYRFKNFGQKSINDSPITEDDLNCKLHDIIQLYQRTISFTKTMGDSYSLCFLFIMTVNLIIIPLNACAILASLHNVIGLLPYAILFNAVLIHIFTIFYPGQRILDHSLSLCDASYCNQWYTTPIKTRKMLAIVMLRCHNPVSLNAGGLFLVNFETFSKVLRTAVSYITVLASFR